ncbi:MAG: preprotein translocase subunit SecE [Microlunatus sp.]|nr:preprotein translocase subunit SecE [Microlunatus sp.]
MAEEKDTDSAPDEGLTESGSVTPETGGLQGEYDELDALDEREDEFDDDDLDDDGDDRELVGVGAVTSRRTATDGSAGTVAKSGVTARERKGRATPKQRRGEGRTEGRGPIAFVKGSVSELKKVVYPTWPQLWNYFLVVLVFVLIIIAIVFGLDYGLTWVMLKAFS